MTWTPEQEREWGALTQAEHEADQHPAVVALTGHSCGYIYADGRIECICGAACDYNAHVLDILTAARLLMDTRRPYTGPIPVHDPTWANEAHPQGAVGAPGAVPTYAERMGWTKGQASTPTSQEAKLSEHQHDRLCASTVCPTCGCCMEDYAEPCGKGCDPYRCGCPSGDEDMAGDESQ
jgi:hypothetical protein